MTKNVVAVIDGEAGSCGKAKVIGEIATDKNVILGASVTNCMPNAGHTFVNKDGDKYVFRNIPVSAVNPKTELFIGPGSAIDMDVFAKEYKEIEPLLNGRKIYVHEMVPLIEEKHKEYEREHIKTGSTFKGCGAVIQDKVVRDKDLKFFKGYKDAVVCSNDEWMDRLYSHLYNRYECVMLEGSQGCDLDLNHSGNYPYVTSRNVSVSQLLADTGIAPKRLRKTIMVIRPFPIRINNITQTGEVCYTGDYGNGRELTWTEINLASLFGTYPYPGIEQGFEKEFNVKNVMRDLKRCPKEYLIQLFGENYAEINPNDVTLLQALELERLCAKAKHLSDYETKYLDLPFFDSDFPDGTIFDQSEQTTVTKKERRVFDLDIDKLKRNCQINMPDLLYLNFFQHLSYECLDETGNVEIDNFEKPLREYLHWLEDSTEVPIGALGTGPENGSRLLIRKLL